MRPRRTIAKLVALFTRGRRSAELDIEIRAHIEFEERENLAAGMSPRDARNAARRKFGNVTLAQEDSRNMWSFAWFESVLQDLRFALRTMRKSPGFTVVAVLTLGLGIGANTAIFSVINTVLLRPLPFRDASRLVAVWAARDARNPLRSRELGSLAILDAIRAQKDIFDTAMGMDRSLSVVTGQGAPERVEAARVEPGFFDMLGIPPLRGRALISGDEKPGHDSVAVLSYLLWRRHFAADDPAIGKIILLGQRPYTIVGVMPPSFDMPRETDLWLPLDLQSLQPKRNNLGYVDIIARRAEGVTPRKAQAVLNAIAGRLGAEDPEHCRGCGLMAMGIKEGRVASVRSALWMLFGAVGFVLLIACTNVANLFLARGSARKKELAIRAALGASPSNLLRQLTVESLLVAIIGGALGLAIASSCVGVLRRLAPPDTPRIGELSVDKSVLLFTLCVSFVTGIAFGLIFAAGCRRAELNSALKEGGGARAFAEKGSRRRGLRMRDLLACSEVALCLVLLIGATLVVRSFDNLLAVHVAFPTDHILTMMISLPKYEYQKPGIGQAGIREILDRMRALPGVESASAKVNPLLIGFDLGSTFRIPGQTPSRTALGEDCQLRYVSSEFFQTLGIRMLGGRDFDLRDDESNSATAIVNQALARRYFPNRDPLGEHIVVQGVLRKQPTTLVEVVGEVADVRDAGLESPPQPTIYIPLAQSPFPSDVTYLQVRTSSEPTALVKAVEQQVWAFDKDVPIKNVQTLDETLADDYAEPRFRTVLLGTFAGLGFFLALIGVYGVVSYSVGRRMREIGIRMALGAQRSDVLKLVLSEGMMPVAAGVVIGMLGALALTRLIQSYLFGIRPNDPATFAMAAAAFAIVAALACYIPARRAACVDPMTTLREE